MQCALVAWLVGQGYWIAGASNAAAGSDRIDIEAVAPDGRDLWVSVKGYPEQSQDSQARNRFAAAVLDLVCYRNRRADVELALGLPDGFATYAALAPGTAWLRQVTPFRIFWVSEDGAVRVE